MKSYNILRCGDQYGWAYHNVSKEHAKYSRHTMAYANQKDINLDNINLIYIHSPDISNYHSNLLPQIAKRAGIKVIGAYAGDPAYWNRDNMKIYSHADLIVTISPQTYKFAKVNYPNTPVVFLPESIDLEFFSPKESYNKNSFKVGWAGGAHKKIKRVSIAQQLDYSVQIQSNWGKFTENNNSLASMKDFYHSLDAFIVTSETECMPRVVLEAMACGLPIISTDVGCVWMLLRSGYITKVNPEDILVQEMNSKLKLLYENPDLREEIGKTNLAHVKKYFSWQSNTILWDNVFQDVIENDIPTILRECDIFLASFKQEFQKRIENIQVSNITQQLQYIQARVNTYINALIKENIPVELTSAINESRLVRLKTNSILNKNKIMEITTLQFKSILDLVNLDIVCQ